MICQVTVIAQCFAETCHTYHQHRSLELTSCMLRFCILLYLQLLSCKYKELNKIKDIKEKNKERKVNFHFTPFAKHCFL